MSDQVAPTNVIHNQTLIAVGGTAIVLGIATRIRTVVIRAHAGNAGDVYVGGAGVTAANGYVLAQGESIALAIESRATMFINGPNVGDGVSYICVI